MNAIERAPYLEAGDAVLGPLGFKRKKRDFEWRRATDRDTEWIHLNFGLDVINPSFGVTFDEIQAAPPSGLGVKCGPHCMLQGLTGRSYASRSTPPDTVSTDILKAIEELPRLHDRHSFAEALVADTPSRLLVISFSDRIRMLPAVLSSIGRIQEARGWVDRFEKMASGRDQMLPSYDEFAAHFREKY